MGDSFSPTNLDNQTAFIGVIHFHKEKQIPIHRSSGIAQRHGSFGLLYKRVRCSQDEYLKLNKKKLRKRGTSRGTWKYYESEIVFP